MLDFFLLYLENKQHFLITLTNRIVLFLVFQFRNTFNDQWESSAVKYGNTEHGNPGGQLGSWSVIKKCCLFSK